jgi:lipoate-protein ligase A
MKCEEKIPGGKLVAIEVWAEAGLVTKAKITGDFFLHPEDAIDGLERSLAGLPLSCGEAEAESRLRACLGGSELIGATAGDLARIFVKAVR